MPQCSPIRCLADHWRVPTNFYYLRSAGAYPMTKRGNSVLSRRRRRLAPKAKGEEGAFSTADICDRLYNVTAELFVVFDAVGESGLEISKVSGLRMILRRQIDEIRRLKDIIHPWTPPSRGGSAS